MNNLKNKIIETEKNNLSLIDWINLMPKDLQKKLCIITWRLFWRDYVPLTAKPPSWLKYKIYIEKTLWEARVKNIHFLHLPFNTLPENKKWIMGCQCDFCKNDTEICVVEKHIHYLIQYKNPYYFTDNFMPKELYSDWNEYLTPIGYSDNGENFYTLQLMKVFDPLCGSYKENYTSKRLREGGKFEFSYPF
jgi:hypothetical protein